MVHGILDLKRRMVMLLPMKAIAAGIKGIQPDHWMNINQQKL